MESCSSKTGLWTTLCMNLRKSRRTDCFTFAPAGSPEESQRRKERQETGRDTNFTKARAKTAEVVPVPAKTKSGCRQTQNHKKPYKPYKPLKGARFIRFFTVFCGFVAQRLGPGTAKPQKTV